MTEKQLPEIIVWNSYECSCGAINYCKYPHRYLDEEWFVNYKKALAERLKECIIDEHNINVGFDLNKFDQLIKELKGEKEVKK